MKDLLILTADNAMKSVLQSFFAREAFAQRLGCGAIEIDPQTDIFNFPKFTDGGLHTQAHEILRRFQNQYRNAIVMLDQQFGAEKPAAEVQTEIETNLHGNGWDSPTHNAAAIVIDPELEVWLWQDNPNVEQALRAPAGLRQRLEQEGVWPSHQAKPNQPKETMQATIKANRAGTPTTAYCRIASKVSIKGCVDPSFLRFRDTLREWFPRNGVPDAT